MPAPPRIEQESPQLVRTVERQQTEIVELQELVRTLVSFSLLIFILFAFFSLSWTGG